MIDLNLFDQEVSSRMNSLNIRDQLQSARNQAYSQVAIAPTTPMELLEPTQVAGPSSAGMMLGIGNSILSGVGSIAGNMAPDPGNIGGGSLGNNWNSMSNYVGSTGFGSGALDLGVTPLTSGMNFFKS